MAFKEEVIKKGEIIYEFYKAPKEIALLSEEEIIKFLESYGRDKENELRDYGLPKIIANPLDSPKKEIEFRCGYTGDLKHIKPKDTLKTDFALFEKDEEYKTNYFLSVGAIFENRHIFLDTYFNKVLTAAYERKIIPLYSKDKFFLGDLFNIRFKHTLNRNSIQNRKTKKAIEEYESNKVVGICLNNRFAFENYFREFSKQALFNK